MMIHPLKFRIIPLILAFALFSCGNEEAPENEYIYFENGRLYFPDGEELALWGVNLQPNLSWEYNSLFKLVGVPLDADTLKKATDDALDEIQKMNCDLVRCHLVPSDFVDHEGQLVETIYLDMLDYMVAEAARRGMYVYLTFLNPGMSYDIDVDDPSEHTPDYVENSFAGMINRRLLIEDEEIVEKSKVYIEALLNRVNPYLGTTYKHTPAIALWEIINEPLYYSYEQIQESPYHVDFLNWIQENDLQDTKEDYALYRHDVVLNYINDMYDLIRDCGAPQPVVWNCNWDRMIRGKEEVFDAIGASKVEVVSFCNYPGQSVCKQPYTKNPVDLAPHDFSSFLKNSYEKEDWYGWALRPDFMKKAKVVYEFEIFYNQSGYLYPAQASFFRAMGVQSASMWHYSMPRYAAYRNGSHHLSLTSTPHKAASYAIAGELFRSVPLYHDYNTGSTTEKVADAYMYSFEKDLSIFSSEEYYMHSGGVSPSELPQPVTGVENVLGYGSSPLVSYEGSGIYTLHITDECIRIEIEPNTMQLKELWGKDFLVSLVTRLDYSTPYAFSLHIDGWDASDCELYRIEDESRIQGDFSENEGLSFSAVPGKYEITR